MFETTALVATIERNKEVVRKLKQVVDSAATISLVGTGEDPVARSMVITGTGAMITGGAVLAGVAVTGIAGPVVLGMAVIPTLAKAGIITGITITTAGLIRGFRRGLELLQNKNNSMEKLSALLQSSEETLKKEEVVDLLRQIHIGAPQEQSCNT